MSARTEPALREAMERLFTGRPTRTDGKLTKNNLWREAGVSRATMNQQEETTRLRHGFRQAMIEAISDLFGVHPSTAYALNPIHPEQMDGPHRGPRAAE